jgi:hypothetical protein
MILSRPYAKGMDLNYTIPNYASELIQINPFRLKIPAKNLQNQFIMSTKKKFSILRNTKHRKATRKEKQKKLKKDKIS